MVRSEKTRQFIIEKTASIFNKKGYTGTYLSDLTEATGLTKGSIYGNFKDKNEVAVEAFKFNYRFQTAKLIEKLNQIKSPLKKLIAYLEHFKTEFKPILHNGGCAILNTSVDADDGNELLKIEVTKSLHSWHKTLVSILEEGICTCELKNIDTTCYAYRMIALIEGSLMLAKTLEKPEILIQNIEFLQADIQTLKVK